MENLDKVNLNSLSEEENKHCADATVKEQSGDSPMETVAQKSACDVEEKNELNSTDTENEENKAEENDEVINKVEVDDIAATDDNEVISESEPIRSEAWDEMIVYNQFMRVRDTGVTIYKGEDAYPYIDEGLFFVADGLGGTGASIHTNFNKNLFEEDKIVSTFFGGIFSNITDRTFCEYVRKSFMELISIKDCYYDNRNNYKHSAYFGSRLVSAIIIHMVKEYKDLFAPDKLFEKLRREEGRDVFIHYLEKIIANYIKGHLINIAKEVGLEHESEQAKQNFKLLATSLCAAIYLEKDDCVEVFYMNAGDSRAYMWDESGLHQVIRDQESADGGMTNFIFAEQGESFDIECAYLSVKKPCVLFNATDGCFDAMPFIISPLAFEKYMLGTIVDSASLKEAGETMGKFFMADENRNDDSSTMAMKLFGYESFEDFQTAAKARLEVIQNEYMDGFEDLLSYDFVRKYDTLEANYGKKIKSVKQRCIENEAIIAYCKEKLITEPTRKYQVEIQNINNKKQDCEQQIQEAEAALAVVFARNFDYWATYLNLEVPNIKTSVLEQLSYKKAEIFNQINNLKAEIVEQGDMTEEAFEQVRRLFSQLENVEKIDIELSNDFKEIRRDIQSVLNFIELIVSGKNRILREINSDKEEYFNRNLKISKAVVDSYLARFLDAILQVTDFDSLYLFEEDKDELKSAIERYNAQQDVICDLEKRKQAVAEQEAKVYCDSKFMSVVQQAATVGVGGLDTDLVEELKVLWNSYELEKNDYAQKASKQKSLLEKYSAEYFKFIEEDRSVTDDSQC